MRSLKFAVALASAVGAISMAAAALGPVVPAGTSTGAVGSYVVAWRQVGATVLVAYKAHAKSAGVKSGTCTVHAKPVAKMAKPGYYSFSPQHFTLAKPTSVFTYIGAFTLPAPPKTIRKVWVSCT